MSVIAHFIPPAGPPAIVFATTGLFPVPLLILLRHLWGGILTELQRSYISRDAPAVVWRHARRITVHRSIPVRHHVKKVSYRCIYQARLQIIGWLSQSPAYDHSMAIAKTSMAR